MAELAFDDSKRMPELRAHAGLELRDRVERGANLVGLTQRISLARVHRDAPIHARLCIRVFDRS